MNLAHTLIYEQRHKNMITPWEIMYDSDRNISITVEAEPNKIYGPDRRPPSLPGR